MSAYTNYFQQQQNLKKSSQIYVWGDNKFGQLGIKELQNTNIQHHSTPKVCQFHIIVQKISCGKEHSALITIEGYLYMMGNNQNGQLGISQRHILFFQQPQLVETLQRFKVNDVSCGGFHTAAVTDDGELFSWGDNQYGQLGINSFEEFYSPQLVKLSFEGNQLDFQVDKVSCGMFHTLILMYDNTVHSFGNGEFGQLGLGDTSNTKFPCCINNLINEKIIDVAAGYQHSLFLSQTGKVFSSGINKQGQLGQGHIQDISLPREIYLTEDVAFRKVSASSYSACLSQQGELYFFGNCPFGQFNIPKRHGGVTRFIDISVGFHFGMALDDDGQVHGWGINNLGQMLSNHHDQNSPFLKLQKMSGTRVQQISCGFNFVISVGDLSNEKSKTNTKEKFYISNEQSKTNTKERFYKPHDFQVECKEISQEEIVRRKNLYNQIESLKEISYEEIERRRKNMNNQTHELTAEEIERRRKQHSQNNSSKELTPQLKQKHHQSSKELTPGEIERRRGQYREENSHSHIYVNNQSPQQNERQDESINTPQHQMLSPQDQKQASQHQNYAMPQHQIHLHQHQQQQSQQQPRFLMGGVNAIKVPQDYFKKFPVEIQSQIKQNQQIPKDLQDPRNYNAIQSIVQSPTPDLKKENLITFKANKIKMPKTQEAWEKIVESKDEQIKQIQQQNELAYQKYQQHIEELIRNFEQDFENVEQILAQKNEDLEVQATKTLSLENQLNSIHENNKDLFQSNEATLAEFESLKREFLERELKYQQIIDSMNSKLADQQKQMNELSHTLEKLQNTDMSVLSVE